MLCYAMLCYEDHLIDAAQREHAQRALVQRADRVVGAALRVHHIVVVQPDKQELALRARGAERLA